MFESNDERASKGLAYPPIGHDVGYGITFGGLHHLQAYMVNARAERGYFITRRKATQLPETP